MPELIKKPTKEELKIMHSQNNSLRAEYFEAINGRDYKPSDIRTHKDDILDFSPKQDVRIRKTVCKMNQNSFSGSTNTLIGRVEARLGTVESQQASFTPVLYFPLAKDINMVSIKSLDVDTVYPRCMIERFKMVEQAQTMKQNLLDLIRLRHSANFYFSPSEENFYFFFDERFFDNFSVDSIKALLPESKMITTYQVKQKIYLAIKHKDISELKKYLHSEEYIDFLNNYANSFLDFSQGEEVILIKYKPLNNNFIFGHLRNSSLEEVDHFYKNSTNIQFVKAVKFGKYLYFYNNGKINPKVAYPLQDKELSTQFYLSYKDSSFSDNMLTVLIKYSQEDWNLLISLQNKLDEISSTLEQFFLSSKSEDTGLLDQPLNNNLLKLLNKS